MTTRLTDEARREVIERELGAHTAGDPSAEIYWRNTTLTCPVIRLPLNTVLLNPRSHRIRAQLQSNPDASIVERDPYSDEAQALIAKILRESEYYEGLLESLRSEGQREPGVVTSEGVLVNANTRAVALQDLRKTHIKVAVLPGNETADDLERLEARLQLQKEQKSDYTFTNELLFVEDLRTKLGYTAVEIARQLEWPERDVDQYQRMLAMVERIRAAGGGENKIPLTDFDDKEQSLKDLDQWYESLAEPERAAARPVLEARSLALVVSGGRFGYMKMREIRDRDFVSDYLEPELAENDVLSPALPALRSNGDGGEAPAGLDLLDDEQSGWDGADLDVGPLLHALTASYGDPTATIPTEQGEIEVERNELRAAIRDVCERAATSAKEDRKHGTVLERPAALAAEAAAKLRSARRAYLKVLDRTDFDSDGLTAALGDVDAALASLREGLGE